MRAHSGTSPGAAPDRGADRGAGLVLACAGALLLASLLALRSAPVPSGAGVWAPRAAATWSAAPRAAHRGWEDATRAQPFPSLAGEPSGLQRHRPLPPKGRGPGFQPGGWPVPAASWARPPLRLEALARRARASTAPARAGYPADRPTIRTCPLRGPPLAA